MANCCGSGARPHREDAHNSALGATRPRKSLRTHRDAAPSLAFSARRLGSHGDPEETCFGKLGPAVRARKRKEHMKRARHKQGSVVCDKRRRVWNYLFCENGVRRTRLIGSLRDFPTKAAAWQAAESFRQTVVNKPISQTHTVKELAQDATNPKECPRVPRPLACIGHGYRTIFCLTGATSLSLTYNPDLLNSGFASLICLPRAGLTFANLLRALMEFAMWCGVLEVARNPIDLVVVKGATRLVRKPRSLTLEQFQRLTVSLKTPFNTMALVSVCLGCGFFGATCFEVARRGLARCQVEH